MKKLDISQPTLYRAAKELRDQVLALGARRNRLLAALRPIAGASAGTPVFMISPRGNVALTGTLWLLHPEAYCFVLETAPTRPRIYSSLPGFLADACPNGYLSSEFVKSIAATHPSLSPRPGDDKAFLEAVSLAAPDLPGNLLVGELALRQFEASKSSRSSVPLRERGKRYPQLAASHASPQSEKALLGGSHPKFTAIVTSNMGERHVVVKFLAPDQNGFAFKDRLVAEELALATLRESGAPAADACFFEENGWSFLESTRYDRIGSAGRVRIFSLSSLAGVGKATGSGYGTGLALLLREGKVLKKCAADLLFTESFARWIGAKPRHPTHIWFVASPGQSLPMLAPAVGISPQPEWEGISYQEKRAPLPDAALLPFWGRAKEAAMLFFSQASRDERLSPAFRSWSAQSRRQIESAGS